MNTSSALGGRSQPVDREINAKFKKLWTFLDDVQILLRARLASRGDIFT